MSPRTLRLLAELDVLGIPLLAGWYIHPVLVRATLVGGTAMAWLFAHEGNIIPLALGQAILGSLVWWAFPVSWHYFMRVGPGYYRSL